MNEIFVYGEIGANSGGISASAIAMQLRAAGRQPVAVRINSPGGDVFEGLAIAAMLRQHRAGVTVHVDALAASIASVIAVAGDEVVMAPAAMLMVHAPSGLVVGAADEMRETAAVLDRLAQSMVTVYLSRLGEGRRAEVEAWLVSGDNWFSADEAIAAGLADRIEEAPYRLAARAGSWDFKTTLPPLNSHVSR